MLDSALEPSYNWSQKSFITAMDTEVDSRYVIWFNPPVYWPIKLNELLQDKLREEINSKFDENTK